MWRRLPVDGVHGLAGLRAPSRVVRACNTANESVTLVTGRYFQSVQYRKQICHTSYR